MEFMILNICQLSEDLFFAAARIFFIFQLLKIDRSTWNSNSFSRRLAIKKLAKKIQKIKIGGKKNVKFMHFRK